MVTHDVDEALFLADRVALMTNGPAARLGAVRTVPFSRPRERHEVMAHPAFFELRVEIMTFLETHAHATAPTAREAVAEKRLSPRRAPIFYEHFAHARHVSNPRDSTTRERFTYRDMDTLIRRIAAPLTLVLTFAAADAQAQQPATPPATPATPPATAPAAAPD